MGKKAKEINAGYEIKERFVVGDKGFALGQSLAAENMHVTWLYNKDEPYDMFWGHYYDCAELAYDDYMDRIDAEISYLEQVTGITFPLPKFCYAINPTTGDIIGITRGIKGYKIQSMTIDGKEDLNRLRAEYYNREASVTKAQESAMLCGCMFGWQTKGADPKNYDDKGKLKNKKLQER